MSEPRDCSFCGGHVEYDAVTPFCDQCWFDALHSDSAPPHREILKWVARVGEYAND